MRFKIEIEKLLEKGAIEECAQCKDQFISSYFLVPKPDQSFRFIFNLKELNKYIKSTHFKLEDMKTALGLMSREVFMEL